MADELKRLRLEMAIEEKAGAIEVSKPNLEWLDDNEWYEFEKAWSQLINYFASEGDTVIGPLALGAYADFIRLIRKALLYDELSPQRREQAEEAIIELEGVVDEILKETMTNLRYHHPELGI